MKRVLFFFLFVLIAGVGFAPEAAAGKDSPEHATEVPEEGKTTSLQAPETHAEQLSVPENDNFFIPEFISLASYFRNFFFFSFLFIGAIGLLLFFTLLLYFWNREKIYLYYFGFLLLNILGAVFNLSIYAAVRDQDFSHFSLNQRNLEVVTLLALFMYCVFTLKLLDVKHQDPKLARWIVYLAGLTSVYGMVYWFIYPVIKDQANSFFIISRAIIMPMALVAILWVVTTVHSRFKTYFIVGSIFYFIGALVAVLRGMGEIVPFKSFYKLSSTVYFEAGVLLETICFALALSYRIFLLNKSKEAEEKLLREKVIYEKELIHAQLQATRMQINPHFIFNCLNAISFLIKSGQNQKAATYLVLFSRFVRMVLEKGRQEIVTLSEELELTEHYLQLERNRFDEKFCYDVCISEEVDSGSILVPPMLLQPFVENAIKHGLLPSKKDQKRLTISISKEKGQTEIRIEDNGVGILRSKKLNPKTSNRKSLGMKITKDRISQFNNNYSQEIQLHITDKSTLGSSGTLVRLQITESTLEMD